MNFSWWNMTKTVNFSDHPRPRLVIVILLVHIKCTLFDAAVSSDLYPDIVQILEGVCTNFVCTHFSNRRGLKSTLDNWLLKSNQ